MSTWEHKTWTTFAHLNYRGNNFPHVSNSHPEKYGRNGSGRRDKTRRPAKKRRICAPRLGEAAYRACVGVETGLGALGVWHGTWGEEEVPPRNRTRDQPARALAPSSWRAEEAERVAGGGRGNGRGGGSVRRDQDLGVGGGRGHRHWGGWRARVTGLPWREITRGKGGREIRLTPSGAVWLSKFN